MHATQAYDGRARERGYTHGHATWKHSRTDGRVHAIIAIDTHGHDITADAVQQGELAAQQVLLLSSDGTRRQQR